MSLLTYKIISKPVYTVFIKNIALFYQNKIQC